MCAQIIRQITAFLFLMMFFINLLQKFIFDNTKRNNLNNFTVGKQLSQKYESTAWRHDENSLYIPYTYSISFEVYTFSSNTKKIPLWVNFIPLQNNNRKRANIDNAKLVSVCTKKIFVSNIWAFYCLANKQWEKCSTEENLQCQSKKFSTILTENVNNCTSLGEDEGKK